MSPATRAARIVCATAILLITLSACARHQAAGAALRFGLVTDVGGLGDQSFNDSAYAGLQQAGRLYHAKVQVLQSRSAPDYQPNLSVLAAEDFDEIIAVGFLMANDLSEVARRAPQRNFAIIDAVVALPNVASLTFKEEDGSFLAGALAAMVTRTRTIAFLGGVDIPLIRKFEAGFAAGAREIDPAILVLVKYVGSFEDVASGKELADVLFDQRADVVFAAAGKAGLGAFEAVRGRDGDYVIGVDADQDGLVPGRVLTSMVKHTDVAVTTVCGAAAAHHPMHGHLELGLRDGAIGLTDFRYTRSVVDAAKRRRLSAIRRALISGRLHPPTTREELERFRPVAL
ncbi:MAG TPA: BMP family ABC transporter substrate-binding protein [Candidatus Binatia bacterium]|nr:BMP family ABC transporter substrate-binding protein [Candidatus Binatia bacterium]